MATKDLHGKATGTFFYQCVQSFSPQEQITPTEAHEIALELAEKFFPGCEVLIATHIEQGNTGPLFVEKAGSSNLSPPLKLQWNE